MRFISIRFLRISLPFRDVSLNGCAAIDRRRACPTFDQQRSTNDSIRQEELTNGCGVVELRATVFEAWQHDDLGRPSELAIPPRQFG